jgi:hypothetical protein
MLVCDAFPDVPDPAHSTQRDVAVLLPKTYAAWQSCAGNLATVAGIIHKQQSETR